MVVTHKLKSLQLFEFKKGFNFPKGFGIVIQDLGEHCYVLWDEIGIQKVESVYLLLE